MPRSIYNKMMGHLHYTQRLKRIMLTSSRQICFHLQEKHCSRHSSLMVLVLISLEWMDGHPCTLRPRRITSKLLKLSYLCVCVHESYFVKELIANGAILDLQQKDGACPLHIASLNNCIDIVKVVSLFMHMKNMLYRNSLIMARVQTFLKTMDGPPCTLPLKRII